MAHLSLAFFFAKLYLKCGKSSSIALPNAVGCRNCGLARSSQNQIESDEWHSVSIIILVYSILTKCLWKVKSVFVHTQPIAYTGTNLKLKRVKICGEFGTKQTVTGSKIQMNSGVSSMAVGCFQFQHRTSGSGRPLSDSTRGPPRTHGQLRRRHAVLLSWKPTSRKPADGTWQNNAKYPWYFTAWDTASYSHIGTLPVTTSQIMQFSWYLVVLLIYLIKRKGKRTN